MIKQPPEYHGLISEPGWEIDPYPAFAIFRRRWPVARLDWPHRGAGDWLISRYADVRLVLRSEEVSIDRRCIDPGPSNLQSPQEIVQEPLADTILTLDDPRHAHFRKPLVAQFSREFRRLEPKLEAIPDALLKRCSARFDLIGDFAAPLAAMMVAEVMGIAPEALHQLQHWSRTYVSRGFIFGPGFVSQNVQCAVAHLKDHIRSAISERHPADRRDFLGMMMQPEMGPMTEQQIVNTGLLLITAGMQTTKHAIANSINILIRHPDVLQQLASDPDLIMSAVEECLRYDGPSQAVGRVTTTEMQLSGVTLQKGSFLRLAVASANRDERQFEHPDVLDVRRRPNHHLAFGFGSHACIGAQMARFATRLAVRGLLRRFRGFSIMAGGEERELYSSLRGFSRLVVVGHT